MLHHMSFSVSDLARSSKFYDAVFGALGYERVWRATDAIGYGISEDQDQFAIKKLNNDPLQIPITGFHVAFTAFSQEAVTKFYAAALKNGGKDNGPPGLRPDYGPRYFAAFVIDPDGYRIEAVHIPEAKK
jgi:catechol 2,3-dioxygenase-like lactoylglutathione lyase family enzyme